MYGGLPTQYNPHSTSASPATPMSDFEWAATLLRNGTEVDQGVWQIDFGKISPTLWRDLLRYLKSQGMF